MAIAERTELKCGSCEHFDTKQIDRTTNFGIIQISGQEVRQGVCRVNLGLRLGVLNEKSSCKQGSPENFFTPRNSQNQ